MKYGRSLIDLANELERQLATKVDMIVPTQLMHHQTMAGGGTSVTIEAPEGPKSFPTTEGFRRQIAEIGRAHV